MPKPSDVPTPSTAFLQALVLKGMARGIPVQEAEDLIMDAWVRAAEAFDPDRGSFESLLLRVVSNAFSYWWRIEVRSQRGVRAFSEEQPTVHRAPKLVVPAPERALQLQQRLLDALSPGERALFTTWALSHHLPRGRFTTEQAAASLDLSTGAYDHARRALKVRVNELIEAWGLDARDFLTLEPDEGTADARRRTRS